MRLVPYPLCQHAIVPFEFPRQVGWLFPLFTFNNVPCKGNTLLRLAAHNFQHIVLGRVHIADVNGDPIQSLQVSGQYMDQTFR